MNFKMYKLYPECPEILRGVMAPLNTRINLFYLWLERLFL